MKFLDELTNSLQSGLARAIFLLLVLAVLAFLFCCFMSGRNAHFKNYAIYAGCVCVVLLLILYLVMTLASHAENQVKEIFEMVEGG